VKPRNLLPRLLILKEQDGFGIPNTIVYDALQASGKFSVINQFNPVNYGTLTVDLIMAHDVVLAYKFPTLYPTSALDVLGDGLAQLIAAGGGVVLGFDYDSDLNTIGGAFRANNLYPTAAWNAHPLNDPQLGLTPGMAAPGQENHPIFAGANVDAVLLSPIGLVTPYYDDNVLEGATVLAHWMVSWSAAYLNYPGGDFPMITIKDRVIQFNFPPVVYDGNPSQFGVSAEFIPILINALALVAREPPPPPVSCPCSDAVVAKLCAQLRM